MDELLEPIMAELKRRNLSEAAVSRAAVGNPSALKNLRVRRGGGTRNHPLENLIAIADSLGLRVSIGKVLEQPGFSEGGKVSEFTSGAIRSAGSGDLKMALPIGWLEKLGIPDRQIEIAQIRNDWMSPTIPYCAFIMANRTKIDPEPAGRSLPRPRGAIYLCRHQGQEIIARVERQGGSHFLLSFDNIECPPVYVPVPEVVIIGRVIWWGHGMDDT